MVTEAIPIIRANYLTLFLAILEESGVDCGACLQQFNLPTTLHDSSNGYLALKPVLSFLNCVVRDRDIDGFILRVSNRLSVSDFAADLRCAVASAPSLQSALFRFYELSDREQSTAHFRLVPAGDAVRICCTLGPGPSPGTSHFGEWLQIMTLSALVRRFAGDRWTPSEIALQSQRAPGEGLRRVFPRTSFVTGQAETCVTFPISLLRLASTGNPWAQGSAGSQCAAPSPSTWDFATSLRAILRSYLCDGYPDISLAARIVGCSIRTLQRRLKDCRLSFSDVVQQARFDVAAQLLRAPGTQVIEAAYAVGYSDPSHFARAFRRVAGISPKQFQIHAVRDPV